ncbi:TrkA family potassium uptake protein [Candidatus Bathyarchaeota archaeon]|nr:TrkA family potassium uptake protein [Candidatus Bathyarchaeota archaeon]
MLIVGLSGIGEIFARILVNRGHKVAVLEKDEEKCKKFAAEVDALVIQGDAEDKDSLQNAGAPQANAVVAATGDDSLNLMICTMAKEFGVQTIIAIVRDPEHIELFQKVGPNVIAVSPDLTVAEHLYRTLQHPAISDFLIIGDNKAEIFSIIVNPDSDASNKKIGELYLPADTNVLAIVRKGKLITPTRDTTIQPGDKVTVFSKYESVKQVANIFTKKV